MPKCLFSGIVYRWTFLTNWFWFDWRTWARLYFESAVMCSLSPFCCYDYEVVNPPCFPCWSVATETEVWNDMTEENNNTAATVTDQTEHSNIITIQTTLGDEGRTSVMGHNHIVKTHLNVWAWLWVVQSR